MNIAIGKFGRSILFDSSKWAAVGGDNEPSALYRTLAEMNPEHTFYMVGKSDMGRCDEEFPANLVDVWADYDRHRHEELTWPRRWLDDRGVSIDGGIMMSGPARGVSQPGVRLVRNPSKEAKRLQMSTHYVGPLVDLFNATGVPYFVVSPDPRYIKMGRDVVNPPRFSLSQYDTAVYYKPLLRLTGTERRRVKIPVCYAGMEKMFLIGRKKPELSRDKPVKFGVVCNQGGNGAPPRDRALSWYVLSLFDDVKIYGKWSDEWLKDERFVGPVPFMKLQEDVLPFVRYTIIIPIARGWVTAKFWEMAQYDIVPFMHPHYDTQRHIDCPDFLRVSSPADLRDKVDALERDPELSRRVRQEINDMLLPEYYDGSYVNSQVMRAFYGMVGSDGA